MDKQVIKMENEIDGMLGWAILDEDGHTIRQVYKKTKPTNKEIKQLI